MPSIGNITVKRISRRHFIPPTSTPIVKGPSAEVQTVPTIVHHAPPSLIGAGGNSPPDLRKFIVRSITAQSITIGAGTVTNIVTLAPGINRSLAETVTISEGIAIQVTKTRSLTETVSIADNLNRN